jgi:hypothetical protein
MRYRRGSPTEKKLGGAKISFIIGHPTRLIGNNPTIIFSRGEA